MSDPPTTSDYIVARLVMDPLRSGRSSLIDAGKALNGVMDLFERLGDKARANEMAGKLQDLADIVQGLNVFIEGIAEDAQ